MYKQASKQKLRIETERGPLSVEQLWDLPLAVLDRTAQALNDLYKKSGKKSYLVSSSRKDKTLKLKFDIVLDVLTTKVDDNAAIRDKDADKQHNAKIDALIAQKQDDMLKEMSIEDLEKKRK